MQREGTRKFIKIGSLVDTRFYANKKKYLAQSALASLILLASTLVLSFFSSAVVIAAIGATTVHIFSAPHKDSSRFRFVLGGYLVGFGVGYACYLLTPLVWHFGSWPIHHFTDEIFGAMAVGLSMFLMALFDLEHPPAAGVALSIVLYEWNLPGFGVSIATILILLCTRHFLRRYLIDLV